MAPDDTRPDPEESSASQAETELPESASDSRSGTTFVEPHLRVAASPHAQRFVIGRTLGEGGMAVIHEATDVQLNRTVAVKRLRAKLAHRDDARLRFFAEAEILAGLDHPGTTSVFEAGRLPDGDCFYAMKKVSGRTLAELLAERTDADIKDRAVRARLLEIFFRVCQTVASAHIQGVIHRDLKPENIMVDDLGVVFVMDWGLAKTLSEDTDDDQSDSYRTQLGAVMGTPAYMSPEQAAGRSATSDRQADVFSLGVILYEILAGSNPFRGDSAVESMKGVMYHDPEAPRTLNKGIGRTLSAITMKAIAKDPFRRYPSAVELADDIRRYREFLPVSAVEPTRIERLINWSRRRPTLAAIAVTLAVVVLLAVLAATYQASIESAMVARAHGYIDDIEARIADLDGEISTREDTLANSPDGPDRIAQQRALADLEAQLEVAEDERQSYALAITGFTVLSPDRRAITILRQSILGEVQALIDAGDVFRARARIRSAMSMYEQGNLFEFNQSDYALLQSELERVQRLIDSDSAEQPDGAVEADAGRQP